MKAKKMNRRGVVLGSALAALVLALMLAGGCAEKITGPGATSPVSVDLGLKSTLANAYRLTVTAADMDTIVAFADTVLGQVLFAVDVPVGTDRRFLAEALDGLGRVIYSGSLTRDVTPLVPVDVSLPMGPAVPMVYLNPHNAIRPIGEEYVITVCVNDLPGLTGAGIGVTLFGQEQSGKVFNPVEIDTVLLDPSQVEMGNTLTYQAFGSSEIFFNISSDGGSIVDENGDGCLVTVHFRTQDNWSLLPQLLFPAMYIENLNGIEQTPVIDGGTLTLFRTRVPESYLDYGGAEIGNRLVSLGGGDVMIGGTIATGIEVVNVSLLMVPLDGGIRPGLPTIVHWSPQLATTDMVRAANGGFLATAAGSGQSSNPGEVVLLAPGGGETWRRTAGFGTDLYAVAARPGGGAVVGGTWYSDGSHLLLASFDANGDSAYYEPTNFSNDQSFRAVLALDDERFVAAGQERPFQLADDSVVLGEYLRQGDKILPVWEIRIPIPGDVLVADLLRTADGGYLIVGAASGAGGTENDVLAIHTDATGNQLWNRTFGGADDETGLAVTAAGDGGYVVAGASGPLRGNHDVLLMKISGGGDLLWERLHGGPNDEIGADILRTGTGFLVSGTSNLGISGGRDVLLLRVDESGR